LLQRSERMVLACLQRFWARISGTYVLAMPPATPGGLVPILVGRGSLLVAIAK